MAANEGLEKALSGAVVARFKKPSRSSLDGDSSEEDDFGGSQLGSAKKMKTKLALRIQSEGM